MDVVIYRRIKYKKTTLKSRRQQLAPNRSKYFSFAKRHTMASKYHSDSVMEEQETECDAKLLRETNRDGDAVVLDDLILLDCVNRMLGVERIVYERVSRHFARILRSTYDKKRISLTISGSASVNPFTIQPQPLASIVEHRVAFTPLQTGRYFKADAVVNQQCDQIILALSALADAVATIFSRFARVSCLRIEDTCVQPVLFGVIKTILKDGRFPVELKRLELIGSWMMNQHFRPQPEFAISLINNLCSAIKELSLIIPMPTDNWLSQRLWATVAKCKSLSKLRLRPTFDYFNRPCPLMKDHLLECLKVIDIAHFESDIAFTSLWLADAFASNDKMKTLVISADKGLYNICSPSVQPILNKLHTIGFHLKISDLEENKMKLMAILNSIPDSGCLMVSYTVEGRQRYASDSSSDYGGPYFDDIENEMLRAYYEADSRRAKIEEASLQLLDGIQFWLKLSQQTGRAIRVHACFSSLAKECLQRALEEIAVRSDQFAGIRIKRSVKNNGTILQFQRAKIVLTVGDKCDCFAS